ncbi:MAG: peptidoglycan DD-metalloendopeptidase family protein [Silanimonas sp.]
MIRNGLVAFSLALAAVCAGALALDWRAERLERERQRELVDARCSAELRRLPKWQGIVAVGSDTDGGRERRTITITPPEGVPVIWGGVRAPTDPFRFRDLPVPGVRLDGPTRFESDWLPGPVRESRAISLQIGPKLWSGDQADRLARIGLEARFPLADASEVAAVEGPDAAPQAIAITAAMGAEVLSPVDGVVVEVEDRFRDLGCPPALSNGFATFPITNRILLHADEGVRVELRHLQQDSVAVAAGQRVARGERLARVGRSGDASVEQLRMTATVMTLGPMRAVPFRFERRGGGQWTAALGAVPDDVTMPH